VEYRNSLFVSSSNTTAPALAHQSNKASRRLSDMAPPSGYWLDGVTTMRRKRGLLSEIFNGIRLQRAAAFNESADSENSGRVLRCHETGLRPFEGIPLTQCETRLF